MILKIGLTGGIGSGKSTACEIFTELGVPVIDADIIAHKIVEPDTPALHKIIKIFGNDLITENGTLDRKKLRHRIFTNNLERKKLEDILHPEIYRVIELKTKELHSIYCIISLPLLLETNARHVVDRVLVIDAPRDLQLARAADRDDASTVDIEAIIDSQISREDRLAAADDIISNEGSIDNLRRQICDLHTVYTSI